MDIANNEKKAIYKVLFIDDEPEILEAIERQLFRQDEFKGYYTVDPLEVESIIDRENIDIIVADVIMPELDGISLLKNLKISHPEVQRLLLTGQKDQNISER